MKWRDAGLGFFFLAVVVAALTLGYPDGWQADIFWQLRLPRVLLAIFVGGGMALAGIILQALFQNPLCDPHLLGVSSGAAIGGLMGLRWASVLGLWVPSVWLSSGGALVGSLVFLLPLLLWSRRVGSRQASLLLLFGVFLNLLGSSIVTLILVLWPNDGETFGSSALQWLIGDLSRANWAMVALTAVAFGSAWLVSWARARQLNLLLLGEEEAAGLGVNIASERMIWLFVASALTAICVSAAGMIGFIGVLVPVLLRWNWGALHRPLLSRVVWLGGGLLVLGDWGANLWVRPREIPVGVMTALIGAPVFLWTLYRTWKSGPGQLNPQS